MNAATQKRIKEWRAMMNERDASLKAARANAAEKRVPPIDHEGIEAHWSGLGEKR